jgi:hypothetical protein
LGSPISTASTFLWQNNLSKAIAVGEGMVVSPEAIICISSVTAIPVRFVRNLWREFLAFIIFKNLVLKQKKVN